MAQHPLQEYIRYFSRQRYPALFDGEALNRLENVNLVFGEQSTEEVILEVRLSDDSKTCDFAFRVDTDKEMVKNYWLELESDACGTAQIAPRYFIDAAFLKPGVEAEDFYKVVLPAFAGECRAEKLRKNLERCVAALSGRCKQLCQLGAMSGRGQQERLRLCTVGMTRANVLDYLADLNWPGDLAALDAFLQKCETEGGCSGRVFLDFDVFEDRISSGIGLNLSFPANPKGMETCLAFLEREGLCLPEKRQDVLRFVSEGPNFAPFIQNAVSHFKVPFENGKPLAARAYLQHSGRPVGDFRRFYAPVQMNLELTSRCPLRCPQCYCDLYKGKDLALDKALYWLDNAAKAGVRWVNLSGGETMCYPHLHELIRFCRDHGLGSNVALSGWGIDEDSLQKLIDCGVSNIYISLNGSTEEVNRQSRDGYDLAIHALELLRQKQFPNTCINWVMHSFNADDFPAMVKLAEDYGVGKLVVLVFKPNSDYELPSVPDARQVQEVAKFIRGYRGPVKLSAENCFSQLRALLGQGFLGNINRGITRGCGAGREGISVSADGKLTPCRHLEIEEDYDDILTYWRNSPTLKALRAMEDAPDAPCDGCQYRRYCLPCAAANYKQKGSIHMGCHCCPIDPTQQEEA